MRDFVNYGSSIDIKVLIFTLLFILIWKFIIEKKNKKMREPVILLSKIILFILLLMLIINVLTF